MFVWIILSVLLLLAYLVLMAWYVTKWMEIEAPEEIDISRNTTVSIIVPARNESENIVDCLQSLQQQQYPPLKYEIIVIDDHSTDNTLALAKAFSSDRLRVFELSEFLDDTEKIGSYKKKAIEHGIDQSNAEIIITIDADCTVDRQWLSSIVSCFERDNYQLITGPVAFVDDAGFTEKFQALDFAGLMLTTGALVNHNAGLMCNGANLSFRKSAFRAVNGYDEVDQYGSGDDVFLMYKINQLYPESCHFLKSISATVYTSAQPNWSAFFRQRIRWASKNKHFKDQRTNIQLLLIFLFNLSIAVNFVLLIILWFAGADISWLFSVFVLQLIGKSLIDFVYLSTAASFFNRSDLLWVFLPAQIMHILYITIVGFAGNIGNYSWKGRKYER